MLHGLGWSGRPQVTVLGPEFPHLSRKEGRLCLDCLMIRFSRKAGSALGPPATDSRSVRLEWGWEPGSLFLSDLPLQPSSAWELECWEFSGGRL